MKQNIRSCYPVSGDWYCVTRQHGEGTWSIERVVLWALMEKHEDFDQIRAITGYGGIPNLEAMTWDNYFVCGRDASPIGKTWDEIYQATPPSLTMRRDITHLFAEWDNAKMNEH